MKPKSLVRKVFDIHVSHAFLGIVKPQGIEVMNFWGIRFYLGLGYLGKLRKNIMKSMSQDIGKIYCVKSAEFYLLNILDFFLH